MSMQVSDFLIKRLLEWNINRIFGFPGDGINGIMGALDRAKDKMDFIQVRHEEQAAFMACAHSKFTGQVGVCLATSGPGAIHLLNGLYDAKMDHQSVVAIVGQSARMAMGGSFQQEVDLMSLFKDVAHQYVHTVTIPMQMQQIIDRAIRIAKAERTVTCVIIPNDIQELEAENPPRVHGAIQTGIGFPGVSIIPPESELQKAADILNDGRKVAILIGAGALGAAEEVKQVADLLGAGVAKALLGKAALPDDLPYVTGAIGLLGTQPSWKMMMECDTLLMIGSSFPYSEFLPKPGKAKGVQIDIDGKMLSLRFPMDVNLLGGSKETLRALIPFLKQNKHHSWRKEIKEGMDDWWKVIDARAKDSARPINPQRVFQELSPRLPDRCIISSDSGTSADWFARHLKIREGMMASLSGNLATMCPGVPYAIAAKFAYPDRIPIALVGDGAMQMLGNSGLITIAKYWKRWQDPRLVILVLHNDDLAQVSWEQRVMTGDPKFSGSQDVPDFPYAEYARLLGLKGIRVDDPEKIGDAWDTALNADRPTVLEMITDPDVPPLPPHISFEMMVKYGETLLKGDPDELHIIKQTWKSELSSL
ncbi:MAG: thiamine pyrophosphate-requiring protein [Ginsengibacter sp.]